MESYVFPMLWLLLNAQDVSGDGIFGASVDSLSKGSVPIFTFTLFELEHVNFLRVHHP
jgi:hypothetical protein